MLCISRQKQTLYHRVQVKHPVLITILFSYTGLLSHSVVINRVSDSIDSIVYYVEERTISGVVWISFLYRIRLDWKKEMKTRDMTSPTHA